MYTIAKLTAEVNETLRKANMTFNCPVSMNGRLTRCLGRAMFTLNRRTGKMTLIGIEFSKKLVAEATDHTIREVLLHETAHVIANMRTNSDNGHNAYFKAVCREIGTTNDKTTTKVEYKTTTKPTATTHRFEVMCATCGVVATYDRNCKTVQNINRFRCTKCNKPHTLTVHQNW